MVEEKRVKKEDNTARERERERKKRKKTEPGQASSALYPRARVYSSQSKPREKGWEERRGERERGPSGGRDWR